MQKTFTMRSAAIAVAEKKRAQRRSTLGEKKPSGGPYFFWWSPVREDVVELVSAPIALPLHRAFDVDVFLRDYDGLGGHVVGLTNNGVHDDLTICEQRVSCFMFTRSGLNNLLESKNKRLIFKLTLYWNIIYLWRTGIITSSFHLIYSWTLFYFNLSYSHQPVTGIAKNGRW